MTFVLVVNDEPHIVRTLTINLRARDYEVRSAVDGRSALQIIAERTPDVIVLDLGLPDMDGVDDLCQRYARPARSRSSSCRRARTLTTRSRRSTPALMTTSPSRSVWTSSWPVSAQPRRGGITVETLAPVQTADFILDFANYRATRVGQEVRLSPTEWWLLSALAARPGHLVTRAQLLRAAWGPSYRRESNYLRVYANQLRRKLGPDTGRP